MGAKQGKPTEEDREQGFKAAGDRVPKSLAEKEEQAELNSMVAYSEYVQKVSRDHGALNRYLVPEDNAAFANIDFCPLQLPMDDQGFVQSFEAGQEQEMKAFFDQYGAVVVRDVLTQEQIERSADELWDAVERCCPSVQKDDPSTWDRWSSLEQLGFLGSHIVLSPQFCDNRQNPKVSQAFAAILGSEELHVNVSRASVMRPTKQVQVNANVPAVDKPEWRTLNPEKWLHWDFNPWTGATTSYSWKVKNLEANRGYERLCVQGILALGDCSSEDGGFCCVPGSHSFVRTWAHQALLQDPEVIKKVNSPYGPMQFSIPPDDPLVHHIQKAPIRAGSLLIWNSKLAHCNFPNSSNRARLIQYITMKRADDAAFAPEFTDRTLLPDDFQLTPLGERLHGFQPYRRP